MKPVVILCSEDAEFCLLLHHILEVEGYTVCQASRPEHVVRLARVSAARAILLDCQSQNLAPKSICDALQDATLIGYVPIAALVGNDSDRHIELIEAGIDTSLVRPLAPARLLQFLSTGACEGPNNNELGRLGPNLTLKQLEFELNLARQCVLYDGQSVDLPPIAFRLLQYFLRYPGEVHTRHTLAEEAWRGKKRVNMRTVDVQIGRLRQSLRLLCGSDLIRTVRFAGYVFEPGRHHG